jgi:hypothetical protein
VDDANKRYAELIPKGVIRNNRTTQHFANTLRLTVGQNKKIKNCGIKTTLNLKLKPLMKKKILL